MSADSLDSSDALDSIKFVRGTHILALDIGGTHPRMAIVQARSAVDFAVIAQRELNRHAESIIPQINDFLRDIWTQDQIGVSVCCASAAGVVRDNKCPRPTNAKFQVDAQEITAGTAIKRVLVINDFEAIAYGVSILEANDKTVIQIPHIGGWSDSVDDGFLESRDGNRAVIGPGTGLGIAYLRRAYAIDKNCSPSSTSSMYGSQRFLISPSEGGHSGMAFDGHYIGLMRFLQNKLHAHRFGKEALISGQGIRHITEFFLYNPDEFDRIVAADPTFHEDVRKFETGVHKIEVTDEELKLYLAAQEQEPEIAAQSHLDFAQFVADHHRKNPKCRVTMRVFMSLLGSAAQDTALQGLASGGVFLAGGILPKNKELLLKGDFMRAFSDNWKPNIRDFLSQTPVYLVDNYDLSFVGCARAALLHNLIN